MILLSIDVMPDSTGSGEFSGILNKISDGIDKTGNGLIFLILLLIALSAVTLVIINSAKGIINENIYRAKGEIIWVVVLSVLAFLTISICKIVAKTGLLIGG